MPIKTHVYYKLNLQLRGTQPVSDKPGFSIIESQASLA